MRCVDHRQGMLAGFHTDEHAVVMVAYAAVAERLTDELAVGRETQLLQVHLAVLNVWVDGNKVALRRLVEGLQLVVVTDSL